MEPALGQHSTGRSAAMFLESYGGPVVRALTRASRAFLEQPPDGFHTPLLAARSLLWLGSSGREQQVQALEAEVRPMFPSVRLVSADEAQEICPVLRPGWAAVGLLEPDASDIAVHDLHQGYARGLRQRGGEVHVGAAAAGLARHRRAWVVTASSGEEFSAPVVVNAAGAWADTIGALAGAGPIGLWPLRRTIFMLAAPAEAGELSKLPLIHDIDETFYFKPEGPQFLCSPADETPVEPGDARPDELHIARALERIGEATTLPARHVRSSWAGLRSFVADRAPVVGFDDQAEGFFWLAGQGGFGIQTAPALSRAAAALIRDGHLPDDLAAAGVTAADLSPARPALRSETA